jgi:hypothetical protein
MKKRVLTIFQYLFFLGLGLFFVWLSVKDIGPSDWESIKSAVGRARKWLILPAFLLLVLAHYSRALRWKILMEPLGYRPSNFNVFASVMIGYLVNAAVPRLGEVVKCTLLAKYEKTRVDKLLGTIVMERAVDVVCLIVAFAGFRQRQQRSYFHKKAFHSFSKHHPGNRYHHYPDEALCAYRLRGQGPGCTFRHRAWPEQHPLCKA